MKNVKVLPSEKSITQLKVKDTNRKVVPSGMIWNYIDLVLHVILAISVKDFKEKSKIDGSLESYWKVFALDHKPHLGIDKKPRNTQRIGEHNQGKVSKV